MILRTCAKRKSWLSRVFQYSEVSLSVLFLLGCSGKPTEEAHSIPAETTGDHSAIRQPRDAKVDPIDPSRWSEVQSVEVAEGKLGAVSSAEKHASLVGVEILKRGGNAVDAAVAVAFALGVTHPSAGGIGGGGFMVIRWPDGRAVTIDYREKAPSQAHRDMYLDADGNVTTASRVGALAAGIPGDVAGFALAHKKYGKLKWEELVQPAVSLARGGWTLDSFHVEDLQRATDRMKKLGQGASAAYFHHEDGSYYKEGDLWKQEELATSLAEIAKSGPEAFYSGDLSRRLVTGVQALGGIWTQEDLKNYRAVEREPIRFDFRNYEVITMPPPSAGGIALRQILLGADFLNLESFPWDSSERVHHYVEILRRVFADRNRLLGDPDFVEIDMAGLLDARFIKERVSDIDPKQSTPSSRYQLGDEKPIRESLETTHFSVIDKESIAVSNTFTLNSSFGAKVVVPGTGIILNNEMDDFAAKPGTPNQFGLVQGEANSIRANKRMLSSMTPTIVVQDGKVRAILGSPGGPTITTTVAQLLLQLTLYKRSLKDAIHSPRIHHQWLPDMFTYERKFPPSQEILDGMKSRGHQSRDWGSIGHANCIEVDPETRLYRAVADVNRDGGSAAAY